MATHIGRVQVWRAGTGAPVVYLHSAAGEGQGTVALELLANRFEVFAPMFPGFGESEGIERIDDMSDAVLHLLDLFAALEIGAPAVVGASLGGWMAAELAAHYPERVSSLVLVNPAGLHVVGSPIKEIFGRRPDEAAQDLFYDQSHPMAVLMHEMAALADDKHADIPFELMRPTLQSLAATAKVAWNPYLHDPKLAPLLPRITAPTLIVHGAEDRLIPRAHSETYQRLISGARLVDVERAGHLLVVEQPEALVDLVVAHVSPVAAATP